MEGDEGEQEDLDSQMQEQLKQLDQQDQEEDMGEGQGEDDEDQLIDIDNLNDNEKAILIQYLQDEYKKNPDQLPMPKEVIEQFLAANQDLIQNMGLQPFVQNQEGDQEYGPETGSPQQNINAGAMVIEGEDNESEQIHGGGQNIGDDEEPIDFQENIQVQNQQMMGQYPQPGQVEENGNLINVNTNAQINQQQYQMMMLQQQ